jgi:hypothetical protein
MMSRNIIVLREAELSFLLDKAYSSTLKTDLIYSLYQTARRDIAHTAVRNSGLTNVSVS